MAVGIVFPTEPSPVADVLMMGQHSQVVFVRHSDMDWFPITPLEFTTQ